jgi:arylsulfatase A-like enzyme
MNEQSPDILLVIADQLRADSLSIERPSAAHTPVIDHIGHEGVRFSRCYTHCASCIASRRSLLTGRLPASHGMVGYRDGVPFEGTTVTELLAQHGYTTMLAGRGMHQSPPDNPFGFQHRIIGSVTSDTDHYGTMLNKALPGAGGIRGLGMSFNGRHARPWPWAEHLHPVYWTVERARELLGRAPRKAPLFMVTSFFAPHPPLIPPAYAMERYGAADLPAPAIGSWAREPEGEGGVDAHHANPPLEALRRAHAAYFGLVGYIDDKLYFLLEEFRERSEAAGRPWMIVFLADHGDLLGDHYLWRKCEPYEGSARIPLLVRAAESMGLMRGVCVDQPVGIADLMPTLLEAAGIPIPSGVEASSLLPVLRGSTTRLHDYVHSEHAPCPGETEGYQMVTDGITKYIWRPSNGTEQLFDLSADPTETVDRSTDRGYHEVVARWRGVLIDHLAGRPEGFVADGRLIPGRPYEPLLEAGR